RFTHKFRDLSAVLNVPFEQDQAPWASVAQESAFIRSEREAGKSCDECAWRHRRGLTCGRRHGQDAGHHAPPCCTTQSPPACFRLAQSWTAASRVANGPTMAR